MIEQGFNHADCIVKEMTVFFDTGVEILELKEDKKKSSVAAKKFKDKKSAKKSKQVDSDSSVMEYSQETSLKHKQVKKYCILHGKCSHTIDKCKELHAMLNKHKQKKKRITYLRGRETRKSML